MHGKGNDVTILLHYNRNVFTFIHEFQRHRINGRHSERRECWRVNLNWQVLGHLHEKLLKPLYRCVVTMEHRNYIWMTFTEVNHELTGIRASSPRLIWTWPLVPFDLSKKLNNFMMLAVFCINLNYITCVFIYRLSYITCNHHSRWRGQWRNVVIKAGGYQGRRRRNWTFTTFQHCIGY